MGVYERAWQKLLDAIEQKTGWGRQELKNLMLKLLVEAANEGKTRDA